MFGIMAAPTTDPRSVPLRDTNTAVPKMRVVGILHRNARSVDAMHQKHVEAIDAHGNETVAYEGERRRQRYEGHQPCRYGGYDGTIERGSFRRRRAEGEIEGERPYGDASHEHSHAHEVSRRSVCGDVRNDVLADSPHHAENQHERDGFYGGDPVDCMRRKSLHSFRLAFARMKNSRRKQREGADQKTCERMGEGEDAEEEQECECIREVEMPSDPPRCKRSPELSPHHEKRCIAEGYACEREDQGDNLKAWVAEVRCEHQDERARPWRKTTP